MDTWSTNSVSKNKNMVYNIENFGENEKLTVVTNESFRNFDKTATLNIFPIKIYYDDTFMATILSFKEMTYL